MRLPDGEVSRMTDEQKFAKAVSKLNAAFVESNQDERIKKPMAKALFQVWKWFDENEPERKPKGNSYPCKRCSARRFYASVLDMHIGGEDCPYVCEEYEVWKKKKEEQEQNNEPCS